MDWLRRTIRIFHASETEIIDRRTCNRNLIKGLARMVWKTPNVTLNLYFKTKTLQVQDKAVEHTRNLLLQSLDQSNQEYQSSTADNIALVNAETQDHHRVHGA